MKIRFYLYMFIALILLIMINSCLFYGYAVNTKQTKLEYESIYQYEKNKKYQFDTTLLKDDNLEITITHCWYNINKKRYESKIWFNCYNFDKEIVINVENIKIEHLLNDKLIVCDDQFFTERENLTNRLLIIPPKSNSSNYYYKIYNSIPKNNVVENVYIELYINGEKRIINKKYNLNYKLHYTTWDIMMSV